MIARDSFANILLIIQRNVAQCFHDGDLSAAAALSYAVNVLEVEAIIVCG